MTNNNNSYYYITQYMICKDNTRKFHKQPYLHELVFMLLYSIGFFKKFIVNTLIVSKKGLIFPFMYAIMLNKEVFTQ